MAMIETLLPESELTNSENIVGDRQLILIQTFDMARLTSHPVPIVPGTFVAVGGRGPKDSNESGKTSFLAATSLLLGDSGWKVTGPGGIASAALLFEPEIAGVSAQAYAAARHGYIIGVFADPKSPVSTALTVWLRISSSTPHILVRWKDKLALPTSRTPIDVDAAWEALGTRNQAGGHSYVNRLYGDVPRCLAWVAKRGSLVSEKSLLQMNAGAFSPRDIAEDLIALTGRSSLFENEREARETLFRQQEELRRRVDEHTTAMTEEEAQLGAVKRRNEARRRVEAAKDLWRLHHAAGLLAVLAAQRELTDELKGQETNIAEIAEQIAGITRELGELENDGELQLALRHAGDLYERLRGELDLAARAEITVRVRADEHRRRVIELTDEARGWAGGSVDEARAAHADAQVAVEEQQRRLGAATAGRKSAEETLAQVTRGGAGTLGDVLERLSNESIAAEGLIDTIELEEEARSHWEPRLSLYREAAVVAVADLDPALHALAHLPGAVLVSGDGGALMPPGIRKAPQAAGAFLAALAGRSGVASDPTRTIDVAAGVHVVGGFPLPIVGHEAQVTAAERSLDSAQEVENHATEALLFARLRLSTIEAELRKALAAQELNALQQKLDAEDSDIQRTAEDVARLTPLEREANRRLVQTQARLTGRADAIRSRQLSIETLQGSRAEHEKEAKELRLKLEGLHVDYWQGGWPGSEEEADKALASGTRKEDTLRNKASLALNEALSALGIASDDEIADAPELTEVIRRRKAFNDAVEFADRAMFPEVLQPLEDWLDSHYDRDLVTSERIERERRSREAEIRLVGDLCRSLSDKLTALQDGIEDRIRQALDQVSREYDRLDRDTGGFGADLLIDSHRPENPSEPWTWEVTPRWRRSQSGRLLSYRHQTNSAQEKQQTVHLVLAALLSSPTSHGRLLLLDEVGDSFGAQHRREVLEAVAQTATSRGVTVLATCQDSLISDAMRYCGEVLYFEYASRHDALNRPTRAFGFDENRERVELTADDILAGRPK